MNAQLENRLAKLDDWLNTLKVNKDTRELAEIVHELLRCVRDLEDGTRHEISNHVAAHHANQA